MYQEVKKKPSKKSKKVEAVEDSESENEDDEDDEGEDHDNNSKMNKPHVVPNEKDIWDPELEQIAISKQQKSSSTLKTLKPGSQSSQLPVVGCTPEDEGTQMSLLPLAVSLDESQSTQDTAGTQDSAGIVSTQDTVGTVTDTVTNVLSPEESSRLKDHIKSSLLRLSQSGQSNVTLESFLAALKTGEPSIMAVAGVEHVQEVLREMAEENKVFLSEDSIYII